MGYFFPSFFQKRMLRYVLSRLDVVETEALDLDQLDISWGKKSTFEFRDVGLHVKLPDICELNEAKIRLLRVSIPSDIYSTGIVVEVNGLLVHGAVKHSGRGTSGVDRGSKANRPRKTPAKRPVPGRGHDADGDALSSLPTTENLAQSFLETEPPQEKARLKAAIARSQHLDQSQISDDGEELIEEGYGTVLSLPGFVADFLYGVSNRLSLTIKDVEVKVSMTLPSAAKSSSHFASGSEDITIKLVVKDVLVHEIKSRPVTETEQKEQADSHNGPARRQVTVRGIRALLITDETLLSLFSQPSGTSSPLITQTADKHGAGNSGGSSQRSSGDEGGTDALTRSILVDDLPSSASSLRSSHSQPPVTNPSHTAGSLDDSTASLGTRQSDFRSSTSMYAGSELSDQTVRSRLEDSFQPRHRMSGRSLRSSPLEFRQEDTSQHLGRGTWHRPRERLVLSDSLDSVGSAHDHSTYGTAQANSVYSSSSSLSAGSFHSSPPQDLTESRLFSHEEAASMYLSATSDIVPESKGEFIPGGWIADDDDDHGEQTGASTIPPASFTQVEARQSKVSGDEAQSLQTFNRKTVPNSLPASDSSPAEEDGADGPDSSPSTPRMASGTPVPASVSSQEARTSANKISSEGTVSQQTRMSYLQREIVHVDEVNIYLPAHGTTERGALQQIPASEYPEGGSRSDAMPGMFLSSTGASQSRSTESAFGDITHEHKPTGGGGSNESLSSVRIQRVRVSIDMALIRMAVLALDQVNKWSSSSHTTPQSAEANPNVSTLQLDLSVEHLQVDFLDALRGLAESTSAQSDASAPIQESSEALLRLKVTSVEASSRQDNSGCQTNISLGRVVSGYSDQPIISFDSTLRMRESVRDMLEPIGQDVTITIEGAAAQPRDVTLMTLPVHCRLDLARVDETLSWLGGLSSVLGIGNSMVSTMKATERPSPSQSPRVKRGVRFDTGAVAAVEQAMTPEPSKFKARIGGVTFDLIGKESSVAFESSALKFVSRAAGIGVTIDRLRLRGPFLPHISDETAITTQLDELRLEYLDTPKEEDLTKLLALLSPSRDPQEADDDIILDNLLKQRRNGGLIRIKVTSVRGRFLRLHELEHLRYLAEEMKKLAGVAKYLPEDDRPGILTLALLQNCHFDVDLGRELGAAVLDAQNLEIGHVTLPALLLVAVDGIDAQHRGSDLIGSAVPLQDVHETKAAQVHQPPSIMLRLIGEEAEPTLKVQLWNMRVEYRVSTLMDILGIKEESNSTQLAAELASSVATIMQPTVAPKLTSQASSHSSKSSDSWPGAIEIQIKDSLVGLNPRDCPAKGFVSLIKANLKSDIPKASDTEFAAALDLQKLALLIINDVANVPSVDTAGIAPAAINSTSKTEVARYLSSLGYVTVSEISAASVAAKAVPAAENGKHLVDIEVRDDLLVLETCADSTQTLQAIFSGLSPPTPPSNELKYRTEIVPVEDMLASFTGDAFETDVQAEDDTDYAESLRLDNEDLVESDTPENLSMVSSFYDQDSAATAKSPENSMLKSGLSSLGAPPGTQDQSDNPALPSFHEQYEVDPAGESLRFEEDHFGNSSSVGGTAHRWNSERNTYDVSNETKIRASPLKVRVRDVNFIWNLFDGYDWPSTRDQISNAVANVESRAEQRLAAKRERRKSRDFEDEDESVIGDFLFNSIYIGIPANHDPRELARQVNRNLDDLASETGSYATTTTASPSPSRQGMPQTRRRRLRLQRSKHHKMTFELRGLSADVVVFPPDTGETQSSIDIRVQDLEIFDHVPTSTWKKFATYLHDMGERESGTSMVHIEMVTVKPVPDLAASEILLKLSVLPLRLHVDQDALDFVTRFFEFREPGAAPSAAAARAEAPFLQRVEVQPVPVRLDFKPKRVDYAGLRSGRTTEFMNFLVLEGSDMVLRHVILYGVSGFDRLGRTLNEVWTPDVRKHQLPTVLAGLAVVRPLVGVGAGVRDLVTVPVREYRRDGRVLRAVQKGATAFARTTTTELARLGAKLAVGTQTVLQNAEGLLVPEGGRDTTAAAALGDNDDADGPPDEKMAVSPYADQPVGVAQGLRGAYRHLERDLLVAKDAIVAMPGEVMESPSAGAAAKAVLRGAPTVILRPALGISKAVGQTLLGATNSLDKGERRRVEDVSARTRWHGGRDMLTGAEIQTTVSRIRRDLTAGIGWSELLERLAFVDLVCAGFATGLGKQHSDHDCMAFLDQELSCYMIRRTCYDRVNPGIEMSREMKCSAYSLSGF